jgi:hypothetical protein
MERFDMPITEALDSIPRRIFLDSCVAQRLRDYGGYIFEGEPLSARDRITMTLAACRT